MQAKFLGYAALWAVAAILTQSAFGQGMMGGPSGFGPQGFPDAQVAYNAGDPMAAVGPGPAGYGVAGCDTCNDDCCTGWCHKLNFFGEFLYLRARNAEIAYANPIDGVITPPAPGVAGLPGIPQGRVGMVDPDYSSGFRAGAGLTLDECSALQLTYTGWSNTTHDQVTANAGDVLLPLLLVPGADNAATTALDANATQNIQFKLIDADYRGLIAYNCDYKVNYLIGARYAKLDQHLTANYLTNGVSSVNSNVNFDGGGLRFGLEGERYGKNRQLFVYGKTYASLIGGKFRGNYLQSNQADPNLAFTNWKAGRLVSIYDIEVGAGWTNYCGNVRLSAGYMFSIWYNTVKNNEWINSVRTNNYTDPSDNFRGQMSFDGFVARAELLW